MNTDHLRTQTNWTRLTGIILSGGYELEGLIEGEPSSETFRVRVLGDRFLQAIARVFQAALKAAAEQLAVWESARSFKHPNLISPLGAGRLEYETEEFVYVVLSRADESLSGVLPERPLTVDEAGEVLTCLVRALTELHTQGFVHGCLSPQQVFAVGELIKLPTDCIRPAGQEPAIIVAKPKYLAPESREHNTTPEADVWCLGATLFETLTQRAADDTTPEEALELPAPFSHVVTQCLNPDPGSRCTLADALAIYRGAKNPGFVGLRPEAAGAPPRPAVTQLEPGPSDPNPPLNLDLPAPIISVSEPVAAEDPDAPEPEPVKVFLPPSLPKLPEAPIRRPDIERDNPETSTSIARRQASRFDQQVDEPYSRKPWIYVTVIALLLLVVLWAAQRKDNSSISRKTSVATAGVVRPTQDNSWETRTLSPDGTAAKAGTVSPGSESAPKRAPAAQQLAANGGAPIWRLVLYTYNKSSEAEKKVGALKTKHPDLSPAIFLPNGHGAPYLVVSGGRMSRESADKLRRRAISIGLPHDSYIQNFKQ